MSKAALGEAVKTFDLEEVKRILEKKPGLREWRSPQGFNLLQFCCSRPGDDRQLPLAKWFVSQGFDPKVIHTTKPGEDGEADPVDLSLVFFAVARAQSNPLARYFLKLGAAPGALFAAAWWGNWEIAADLVEAGEDVNRSVDGTPLHMAVNLIDRGVERDPDLAKRRVKMIKELLRLGADPAITDDHGRTPREAAARKKKDVRLLIDAALTGASRAPGKNPPTRRRRTV